MNTKMIRMARLTAVLAIAGGAFLVNAADIDSVNELVNSGAFADAKEQATELIASEPSAAAYLALGKAEFGLKDYEASIKALSEAIKLEPENANAYSERGLARTFKGMGMNMFAAGPVYMKSLDDYKKAVAIDPDLIAAHIGLARYYSNAPAIGGGSMKKAKEHAAEVARISPYQGHIEVGLVALLDKRPEDAKTELAAAYAMNAKDEWLTFELAKVYQMTGDMPAAKEHYEALLELNPEHEGAKAALNAF